MRPLKNRERQKYALECVNSCLLLAQTDCCATICIAENWIAIKNWMPAVNRSQLNLRAPTHRRSHQIFSLVSIENRTWILLIFQSRASSFALANTRRRANARYAATKLYANNKRAANSQIKCESIRRTNVVVIFSAFFRFFLVLCLLFFFFASNCSTFPSSSVCTLHHLQSNNAV